jgi:hypothetical protein
MCQWYYRYKYRSTTVFRPDIQSPNIVFHFLHRHNGLRLWRSFSQNPVEDPTQMCVHKVFFNEIFLIKTLLKKSIT